jgi:hypothetical protein
MAMPTVAWVTDAIRPDTGSIARRDRENVCCLRHALSQPKCKIRDPIVVLQGAEIVHNLVPGRRRSLRVTLVKVSPFRSAAEGTRSVQRTAASPCARAPCLTRRGCEGEGHSEGVASRQAERKKQIAIFMGIDLPVPDEPMLWL